MFLFHLVPFLVILCSLGIVSLSPHSELCAAGVLHHPSVTEDLRHRDVWLPWVSGTRVRRESESLCDCTENQSHRRSVQPHVRTENQGPACACAKESESLVLGVAFFTHLESGSLQCGLRNRVAEIRVPKCALGIRVPMCVS